MSAKPPSEPSAKAAPAGAKPVAPAVRTPASRAAETGTSARPASRPSAGTSPLHRPEQRTHSRACRAMRLRHSAEGCPSQPPSTLRSSSHAGCVSSARSTTRADSSWAFIRCTRTAVCCGDSSSAAATSTRVSSPAHSSHHSDSSARSSGSSQRVARAVSRRCPARLSRTTVRSTKSAPGSATSSAASSVLSPKPLCRDCQCARTRFIAIATSQERKLSSARRPPSPSSARSIVSCTTSSTSQDPLRARPTML